MTGNTYKMTGTTVSPNDREEIYARLIPGSDGVLSDIHLKKVNFSSHRKTNVILRDCGK